MAEYDSDGSLSIPETNSREYRLFGVLMHASRKRPGLWEKIDHLRDHEGSLTVAWKVNTVSHLDCEAIAEAWESVNELASNVEYTYGTS